MCSLFPGAKFRRTLFATSILQLLVQTEEVCLLSTPNTSWAKNSSQVFALTQLHDLPNALFTVLNFSSYEECITASSVFLQRFQDHPVNSSLFGQNVLEKIMTLLKSCCMRDMEQAIVLTKYVFETHVQTLDIDLMFTVSVDVPHQQFRTKRSFLFLQSLSTILGEHLIVAKSNLLVSSQESPLTAVLACIRY